MRRFRQPFPRSPRHGGVPWGVIGRPAGMGMGVLLVVAAIGLAALTHFSCGRAARAPRLLIIGLDGADWRVMGPLMKRGELPNLQSLTTQGVGCQLFSLYPIISPVIWTTIATGKGPDKHGILDFTMPDPTSGRPVTVASTLRNTKAFWNITSEKGLRTCVIGWWASWPAEPVDGVIVSDRMGDHGFIQSPEAEQGLVFPAEKQRALLALKEDPARVPYSTARQFMEVSEAEYDAAPALDFRDPISHFRIIYATLTSYAAMARQLIEKEHPAVVAVYFEGIDTAGHMFMRYAPPDYPYTTPDQRRKFGDTVNAFYRYQDQLIGQLLKLTDANTTIMVASDHGFYIGSERPLEEASAVTYATASRWHRPQGVLILKGPQIKVSGLIDPATNPGWGASVFDITPTLLALLDLPAGADMDGRVLTPVLVPGYAVPAPIPTYDDEAWRSARAANRTALPVIDEQMQERLRSLGYIGSGELEETLSLRAQWGLAEYYMFRRDFDNALRELEKARVRAPDSPEAYYMMGAIYAQRREYDQARAMYERALALAPEKLEALTDLATLLRLQGDLKGALELLERAARIQPYNTGVQVNLGMLQKELGQLDRAQEHFRRALQLDPECHPAHAQLALLYEQLTRWPEALAQWQEAARLQPGDRIAQEHLRALQERGVGASR